MNQFTKEDLEDLSVLVYLYIFKNSDDHRMKLLGDKIESLIDKFCPHELLYEDRDYCPMRCTTCLDIVEHE